MAKVLFNNLIKASPWLLAIFYLQGMFYYIGQATPFHIPAKLYPLSFNEALNWTAIFYITPTGIYLVSLPILFAMVYPFIKPIFVELSQKFADKLKRRGISERAKWYITSIEDDKVDASLLFAMMWGFFIFAVFLVPYLSGVNTSEHELKVSQCKLTKEGKAKFKGDTNLIIQPSSPLAKQDFSNVWIIHRSDKFYSVYDGENFINIPTSQIVADIKTLDIFSDKKSEQEQACERKVKESE